MLRARLFVVCWTTFVFGTCVSAEAQIFQPGTQPTGEEGGLLESLGSSTSCRECHGDYRETDRLEPWDGWRGSLMANAGRDPVFRAALAIAEKDNADAADFCIRCHSPAAWLRGRSSLPEWSEADGPRFLPDERAYLSADLDGVGCTVCHRATDNVAEDPDAPHLQNAQIYFLDGADAETRLGPYEDTGGAEAMHPVQKSEFTGSSQLCGQCHDIVNPVVTGLDASGASTGRPFVIERTYSEWLHSDFSKSDSEVGASCIDCHLKRATEPVRAAIDGTDREYFRVHQLLGGSTWVQHAITDAYPEGTEVEAAHLRDSAEATRAFLREAAELTVEQASVEGDVVSAQVRVTNRTGHKLPTGYPEGRRVWLQVEVIVDGETVSSSAPPGVEETDPDPTSKPSRTYEVKLGVDGEPSFHFIENNTVLEDTRIPPQGFSPPDELDMTPVGRNYQNEDGSYRHYDDAKHTFYPCAEGEATLRARLWYQGNTRQYMEFLRDNAPDSLDPTIENWGAIAYQKWLEHGGSEPVLMSELSQSLGQLEGLCPAPPQMDKEGCACRTRSKSHPEFFLFVLAALTWRRSLTVSAKAEAERTRSSCRSSRPDAPR